MTKNDGKRWVVLAGVLGVLSFVAMSERFGGSKPTFNGSEPRNQRSKRGVATLREGRAAKEPATAMDSAEAPAPKVRAAENTNAAVARAAAPRQYAPKPLPDSPWRHAGMCMTEPDAVTREARVRYFASFVPTSAWHTTVYAAPGVAAAAVEAVRSYLEPLHQFATGQLGLESEPPPILIYPTTAELRAHSCTSKTALAYYDGAIHITAELTELRSSLRHEYAHHVLVSNGIAGPMWFQEGTAMSFARDCRPDAWQRWREHPLDLERMLTGVPHTAAPEDAAAFNAQACVMHEFLERLCLNSSGCGVGELANALTTGQATPQTLFDWAISRRGSDLFRTTSLPLWSDYTRQGDFGPATKAALLARAGLRAP